MPIVGDRVVINDMPRRLRIQYAGAVDHFMARGNAVNALSTMTWTAINRESISVEPLHAWKRGWTNTALRV